MSSFDEVKLKIKVNNGYVDEEEPQVMTNNQLRICDVCGKQFSCGKALGGHKRIHQQLNDKDATTVKTQNQKIKIQPAVDIDDNYICYMCGKSFPSLKSVYGHMRCHPERKHRGMRPPSSEFEKLSSPSSTLESRTSDDDQMLQSLAADNDFLGLDLVDLSECLAGFGWSSKAKRGRKAILSQSSIYVEEEQIPYEAVQTLMLLGQDKEKGSKRKEHFSSAGKERGIQVKKLRIDISRAKIVGDSKNQSLLGAEVKDDAKTFGSQVSYVPLMKGKKKLLKVHKIFERPQMMMEDNDKGPDAYKCNTCDKTFPTHQALGGHRSSHIKFKNLMKCEDDSAFVEEENCLGLFGARDEEDDEEIEAVTENYAPSPKQHQCKICNKIFPTGQALGGHRRGTCFSPAASPEKMIARNIDLNLLPTAEEEAIAYPQLQQPEGGELIGLC